MQINVEHYFHAKHFFQLPYRVVYPSCKPNEWKVKSTGEERKVRVVQLIDPRMTKDDEEDDDDEEEVGKIMDGFG